MENLPVIDIYKACISSRAVRNILFLDPIVDQIVYWAEWCNKHLTDCEYQLITCASSAEVVNLLEQHVPVGQNVKGLVILNPLKFSGVR